MRGLSPVQQWEFRGFLEKEVSSDAGLGVAGGIVGREGAAARKVGANAIPHSLTGPKRRSPHLH